MFRFFTGESNLKVNRVVLNSGEYCLLAEPAKHTLHSYLSQKPKELNRLQLIMELARTIAKLHASGTEHNNLLPSRLNVTTEGQLKMTCYENPKMSSSAHSITKSLYMAPEVAITLNQPAKTVPTSAVFGAADIYSLGVLCYDIWNLTRISSHFTDALVDKMKAPQELKALLKKCTFTDPTKRCTINYVCSELLKVPIT